MVLKAFLHGFMYGVRCFVDPTGPDFNVTDRRFIESPFVGRVSPFPNVIYEPPDGHVKYILRLSDTIPTAD